MGMTARSRPFATCACSSFSTSPRGATSFGGPWEADDALPPPLFLGVISQVYLTSSLAVAILPAIPGHPGVRPSLPRRPPHVTSPGRTRARSRNESPQRPAPPYHGPSGRNGWGAVPGPPSARLPALRGSPASHVYPVLEENPVCGDDDVGRDLKHLALGDHPPGDREHGNP